jgi:hypothetical protein
MNRVLNKDFDPESYLNSALSIFSDVFHPASCMQSCDMGESESRNIAALVITETSYERVCASRERRI